jgi:hypothetical protein
VPTPSSIGTSLRISRFSESDPLHQTRCYQPQQTHKALNPLLQHRKNPVHLTNPSHDGVSPLMTFPLLLRILLSHPTSRKQGSMFKQSNPSLHTYPRSILYPLPCPSPLTMAFPI